MRIPTLCLVAIAGVVAIAVVACRPPDPPRAGTLLRDQTFEHDGKQRRYHFYIPPDVDTPRPLVLSLHGGGGEIDDHIGLDAARWPHQVWLDLADEEDLFILVPSGIDKHWNDCRPECVRCGQEDDLGFILALMDELQAEHNIDVERVFSTGESNGGFMTQSLAQVAPERFAAVGVVIALLNTNTECEVQDVPMPIMYQVGTDDDLVPFEGGSPDAQIDVLSAADTVAHWREVNGCDEAPSTRQYDDLDPDDSSVVRREDHVCSTTGADIAFLTMDGAGHVAPSIDVEVSGFWEGLAGVQNHDIEGAREFWEFFKDRSRPR